MISRAKNPSFGAKAARRLLRYDPASGRIFRLVATSNRIRVGDEFGQKIGTDGYKRGSLFSIEILAHRMAWLLYYGEWPSLDIDHKDGNRSNNRIENLRSVSIAINQQNFRKPRKDSQLGILGVSKSFNKPGQFRARISFNGKQKTIGYFATAEEAKAAYVLMKRKVHEGCTI